MSKSTEERLKLIEKRLSGIEGQLQELHNKNTITKADDMSEPSESSTKTEFISEHKVVKPGNWLGIVAVICFVLAAGFIIKLSIESGWLTLVRQIGLAVLFGISLIVSGFLLIKLDRGYASYLPGAGIIVLYLATFASHRYYNIISFDLAIALVSLVSGLCIGLFMQIKHDVYAVTAAVGAYISPVILGLNSGDEFSLYYFLICSAVFAFISIWLRSRTLILVSAYLAILASAVVGSKINKDLLVSIILVIHFLIFSIGTYFYTIHNRLPLRNSDSWCFLPVLLVFYAMEYYFIERIQPGLAPWISLGFAAVLIGLYASAKKYFPDSLGSHSLVLSFTTLVCFHSVYLELLPEEARPWLFVTISLITAFSLPSFTERKRNTAYYIPILAVIAILIIEYVTILYYLIGSAEQYWLFVSCAAFASLWLLIVKTGNSVLAKQNKQGLVLLVAAHLIAVTAFYRLTTDFGSLAVSASWLLYAVIVMAFAFTRKDKIMAKSALLVLGFAAGKALLYDAASVATVLRIGCLLLTGIVLYGCGLLMRKIADWKIHV